MKAEIFYFNNDIQRNQYREIASALRKHVYEDIEVTKLAIVVPSSSTSKEANEHSKRYLNLLKASTIKTSDFDIVVRDDGFQSYSYMGGYRTAPGHFLQLFHRSMPKIFPAVVMMNRLVMVPQNMREALENHEVNWFLKPLDLWGVLLVDFQDEEAIHKAAEQVGTRLKWEISKLCSRHMLTRKIPNPAFTELSLLLNIDERYLKLHEREIKEAMVQLVPNLVSGPVILGKLSPVTLELRNKSDNTFDRVHVQIRAPKDTLKSPVSEFVKLPAGGSFLLKFEVTAKSGPYCPLEVLFNLYTLQDAAPFPLPVKLPVLSQEG